jgi:hypothetical protein
MKLSKKQKWQFCTGIEDKERKRRIRGLTGFIRFMNYDTPLFVHYMLLFKTMFHFSRWSVKIRSESVFIDCMHLCMAPYMRVISMRLLSYFTPISDPKVGFFQLQFFCRPTSIDKLSGDISSGVACAKKVNLRTNFPEMLSTDKLSGDKPRRCGMWHTYRNIDRQTICRPTKFESSHTT